MFHPVDPAIAEARTDWSVSAFVITGVPYVTVSSRSYADHCNVVRSLTFTLDHNVVVRFVRFVRSLTFTLA